MATSADSVDLAAASAVPFGEAVRQLIARGLISNARAGAAAQRHDRKSSGEE